MALTYDIRGSELRTPVLIVVIVSTVVIPITKENTHHIWSESEKNSKVPEN